MTGLAEEVRLELVIAMRARGLHSALCHLDNNDPEVRKRFDELDAAIKAAELWKNPTPVECVLERTRVMKIPGFDFRKISERIEKQIDADIARGLVDPLGLPLGGPDYSTGTFSNPGAVPPIDMSAIVAAARQMKAIEEASKPERFDFGAVSVAGFWLSIQKVEFKTAPRLTFDDPIPTEGDLVITSLVPDRNTGKPIGITFTKRVTIRAWEKEGFRLEIIRMTIREWLMHELDEHLYIDGKRAFEPHRTQPWIQGEIPPLVLEDGNAQKVPA